MNKNQVSGKPVQLIEQKKGMLFINSTIAEKIKAITGSIGVIAVIGPYRTGKSYIMNRLLNRSDGFTLGDTYDSCTRGIWMWDNIIKHTNKLSHSMHLIYLDTEVSK